jgi:hypothetical protein
MTSRTHFCMFFNGISINVDTAVETRISTTRIVLSWIDCKERESASYFRSNVFELLTPRK